METPAFDEMVRTICGLFYPRMTRPCIFCGGAAHPATGHCYSATAIACWRCTLEMWRWTAHHTSKRQGKRRTQTALSFYEAAAHVPPRRKP